MNVKGPDIIQKLDYVVQFIVHRGSIYKDMVNLSNFNIYLELHFWPPDKSNTHSPSRFISDSSTPQRNYVAL